MAPRPTADELWGSHLMPATLVVTILTPNGLMIDVNCTRESTLESIKDEIWKEAKNQALFRLFSDESSYIFVAVTQDSKVEEFYDESRRLCDLRLFQPILKLVEPVGNKEEKILASEISLAIGRPVNEFDMVKDPEVIDFRRSLLDVTAEVCEQRESLPNTQKAMCFFPPEFDEIATDTQQVKDEMITISSWFIFADGSRHNCKIVVSTDSLPQTVAFETLKEFYKIGNNQSREEQEKRAEENKESFVLKVCGVEQYLLGNHHLAKYKYIRMCISQGIEPQLLLMDKLTLFDSIPKFQFATPAFLRRMPQQPAHHQTMSLWKVESMFRVRIVLATYVNVKDVDQIYVKAGIYHGTEAICESRCTKYVFPQNPRWDEVLEFDLYMPDIPISSRLCLSICAVTYRKKREEHCAIAWGNLQLFDYRRHLLADRVDINLWPMPKGHDELLNPLGMIGSNPNKDSSCLQILFDRFSSQVVFPTHEQIKEYAEVLKKLNRRHQLPAFSVDQVNWRSENTEIPIDTNQLNEILRRDPLSDLSEQEKDLLWRWRNQLTAFPESLPKLLDAVKWNVRDETAQLYCILEKWPTVKVETSLELLDCKYADLYVRSQAVKWLDLSLSDEMLLQFLLQLVQVLKKEPYMNNELSKFMLRRALMNQRIGHVLFWHLKAEMSDYLYSMRCGIILEAYCRGLPFTCLRAVVKQVGALEKLEKLTDILKERKDDTQKDRLRFLYENVSRADYLEVLQDLQNPINSSLKLGNILVDDCRIMDSAKRPLWLVWSNPDVMGDCTWPTNALIFKSGDDLRQDMLTLQVIRIMDLIWRRANLDLKLLPYTCLATGRQVGMIEVVRNAKTVMNIQRTGGRMAAFQVDSSQLNKWIKEKNKDTYNKAVDNFMRSCAGYCVATFILGIGDRNPDNIMINEDGRIFHIDFGHFLGHFKKKFGINRERVPFVLTYDFLQVITKGAENPLKSKEFEAFQKMCGDAYLALHDHANLLITLFVMMLSTGIPELQSMEDIGYLRQTLQVEKDRVNALKYFETQLDEAHGGAWSTKLDWFFHCVKHSSKV